MRARSCTFVAALLALAASGLAADLADAVAEDVVLYAEVADPKGIWADFQQSGARDLIARTVPQGELALIGGVMLVQQGTLQQLGIRLDQFVDKHASRFALVYPDIPTQANPFPCLLLDCATTKTDMGKLLRDTVEATVKANHPGATAKDELHQDIPLRVLTAGGHTFAHAFLGDTLAVGQQATLRKLIDGRVRRPLSADKTFAKVRKKLAVPKGLMAFVNVRRIFNEFRARIQGDPSLGRKLDDFGVSGVQWLALTSAFDGRGIRDRVYLHAGEGKVGLIRLLMSLSPGTAQASTVLPKTCPIVGAVAFKGGPELWEAVLAFLAGGGELAHMVRLDQARDQVRVRLGIDFDHDFVAALGGEVFVAANPDVLTEFAAKRKWPSRNDFPVIIGFRVAKRGSLASIIHRVVSSQPLMAGGLERKVAEHRGTEISTLILPGTKLQPSYAFVGDYLLIAKSKDVLAQCIDAHATGETLATARRFTTFPKTMPAAYNAMVFADLQRVLRTALDAPTGPDAKAQQPTLRALAGELRSVYATLSVEPDGITVETYTRPGLLGLVAVFVLLAQGGL